LLCQAGNGAVVIQLVLAVQLAAHLTCEAATTARGEHKTQLTVVRHIRPAVCLDCRG
jgi:hypothetical protein